MNTLGCHAIKPHFGTITVPYIQGLFFVHDAYWLVHSPRDFPDVFSPGFVQRCETIAERVVVERKDDPYLMGYTFTNVPILTDLDADAHGQVPWGRSQPDMPTWPRVLRNLGANSPGKRVFVGLVRDRYADIGAFNRTYRTSMASFDELTQAVDWSPTEKAGAIDDADDNRAFLLKILEQYYAVACAAVRKFDANHMIFGDPLNANAGVPDDVMSVITRHVDLVAYQFYGPYDEHEPLLDHWSELTGKPLFHADSSFAVAYKEMPDPIGSVCPDQETRARRFLETATRSIARPDCIGWNWCGWMDMWAAWKSDRQHTGLQDPFGNYHHPMPEVMAKFGAQLYEYGLGKRPPVMFEAS